MMASIHHEIFLDVPVEKAWAALREVGSAHRLFAGVLTDGHLDGDVRTVSFANGLVVREQILDIDEADRRLAYAVIDNVFDHHSASMQIFAAGNGRSRFVWITDFLPAPKAAMVRPLVEQGSAAMKRVLEST